MVYDKLIIDADAQGVIVKEKPLEAHDGRIKGNKIAIRASIPTRREKACVLAEELGHYFYTSGDIIDQSSTRNRKQELLARVKAYNHMVGLTGIIRSYEHGCRSLYEMAEYLEVTETFLADALEAYRLKYGEGAAIDNYYIAFEPYLSIVKMI